MTTRDEARAALAVIQNRISASRLGRSWARETDTDILAMRDAAKALTALLDEPVPADEHEALAQELIVPLSESNLRAASHVGPGWSWLAEGRTVADAILAAGFRRQGPITDAMVDAAVEAWTSEPVIARGETVQASARRYMRAALEAAEATR